MGAGSSKPHESMERPPPSGVAYSSPAALSAAITDRIAAVVAGGSPYTHSQLRRHVAFDRILARLFAHEPGRWVLKGGGGLLARLPTRARHSLDLDVYFAGQVAAAVTAIDEALRTDLRDYFAFEVDPGALLAGEVAGRRLRLTAWLDDRRFDTFGMDVVVETSSSGPPDEVAPIRPVHLPGLWSPPYRVHRLADQLADKFLAMVTTYGRGRSSSRHRDLVDIVLLATTHQFHASDLHTALYTGLAARGLDPPHTVELPGADWHEGYAAIAATVPDLSQDTTAEALSIARAVFDPVLSGRRSGVWQPDDLSWSDG